MFVSSCGMSDSTHPEVIDNIFFDDSIELNEDSTYYKITSPNGGETWEELSTQTITWESSGDVVDDYDRVYLYYSLNSGIDWTRITYYIFNTGSYSWTLPGIFITNSNFRIKIVQYDSPYIEDISDADFTIIADGGSDLITLQSPNGGESWHEGSTQTITWSTSGDIGGNDVYVGYSTDGGNFWYDAVVGSSNSYEETTDPPSTIRWDVTSNDGSYSWSLPNFSDTLEACIIGVWSAANTSLYDMNDNYFTITCDTNYYRILYPNGGEMIQMGTERIILWESGGDVGSVSLWYSEYDGDSWYSIDDNETNDGSYVWSVPTLQSDNPNCLIKIEDRSNSGWFDVSDATFTITDTEDDTSSIFIEEHVLDFTQYSYIESSLLELGVAYYLKISGVWGGANGDQRDAAFWIAWPPAPSDIIFPYPETRWGWDRYGLICQGLSPHRPIPDEYNEGHIYYFYFTGDGTSEEFCFQDGAYGDNSGSLTIQIWQMVDPP